MGAWNRPKPLTPAEKKALLEGLNSRSAFKANEAAQDIIRSSDPRLLPGIIRTLRSGRRLHNRIEAAYALRTMDGVQGTATLERIVSNRAENPHLRAFAAEGLAGRHRARSHTTLLRNITDGSREVRFWCAFALGQMRERKALPFLRALADKDHRILRGWWEVSKEARDAIRNIERGWGIRFCPLCPPTRMRRIKRTRSKA